MELGSIDSAGSTGSTGQQGFNREQVVSLARDDLNFLAPFLMPEEFRYNFTAMHLVAWSFFVRFILESELP
jgi:hypothetical protein